MSDFTKAQGSKIAIRFTYPIIGNPGDPIIDHSGEHATGKPSTAQNEQTGYESDKAFDGNESTYWRPGYRLTNRWVRVDLESSLYIDKLVLRQGSGGTYTTFRLEGSNDDSEWHTVIEDSQGTTVDYYEYEFSPVQYRYWRVIGLTRSANYPGYSAIQLHGAVIGNEVAFTVTGSERWMPGGPLTPREYQVLSVDRHPDDTEGTDLLLTMAPLNAPEEPTAESDMGGRFNNVATFSDDMSVAGEITVAYDISGGNLEGTAGPVESFSEPFTPTDLEAMPDVGLQDHVVSDLTDLVVDFKAVDYLYAYGDELVTPTVSALTVTFTHVDDLDP